MFEFFLSFCYYHLGLIAEVSFLLQLAWTCYNFYQSTPTKLAGENYFFHTGQVRLLFFERWMKISSEVILTFPWHVHIFSCCILTLSGYECGYIMEHIETRDCGITLLLVASNRKQDISRMGLEHIPSFWKELSYWNGLCRPERCMPSSTIAIIHNIHSNFRVHMFLVCTCTEKLQLALVTIIS